MLLPIDSCLLHMVSTKLCIIETLPTSHTHKSNIHNTHHSTTCPALTFMQMTPKSARIIPIQLQLQQTVRRMSLQVWALFLGYVSVYAAHCLHVYPNHIAGGVQTRYLLNTKRPALYWRKEHGMTLISTSVTTTAWQSPPWDQLPHRQSSIVVLTLKYRPNLVYALVRHVRNANHNPTKDNSVWNHGNDNLATTIPRRRCTDLQKHSQHHQHITLM